MENIDVKQGKSITYMIVGITILTGVVGILAYLENKKHHKINNEVLALDKQIKTLELAIKKNEAQQSGIED
jgi:hypothetical protein